MPSPIDPIDPVDPKYAPPALPRVLSRQRLLHRLTDAPQPPLTLVIGQAAQGKSTLIAEALSKTTGPAAWLHLDDHDGDSANFYHSLVNALVRAVPGVELNQFLEQAHIKLGTSTATVRHEALLKSLWQRLPRRFTLVLDSLEAIRDDASCLGLCRRLVDLSAAKGRLIMISRQPPPVKMQKWVMRRKVMSIDNRELAFTRDEIQDYFESIHGYRISSQHAARLLKATGGWAGGLVLISQSLGQMPRDQWQEFLAKGFPDNPADAAWRYFAEEVFDALPDHIREILTHASQLEVVDPEILAELVPDARIQAVLDDLVQRNLFIQAVHGAQGRPLYRLNHLFRQFLQRQYDHRYDDRARRSMHLRMGEIYKGRREAEVAIDFFLQAKAPEEAAACIKKAGIDLVIRGRFNHLERALQALPDELIQADTWLLFLLTLTRRVSGGARNIQDFQKVVDRFGKENDTRGRIMALAYLIEAQVFSGHHPMACQTLIHEAEGLLAAQGDAPYYIYARTLLWLQVGFGYIASGIEIAKGISACQNAYLLAHKIANPRLMANANIVAVMGLAARGDFELADEALEKIAAVVDKDAYTEYHALRGLVNAELSLRRGDFKGAGKQLAPLARQIETFGLLFLYPAFVDTTGMLQIYQGEYEAARTTCRHLLDVARLSANAQYEGLSHRLNALRLYHQGRHIEAAAEADQALAMLPRDKKPTLHWMRTLQLAGLIQNHLDRHAAAEAQLRQCRDYYAQTANTLSLCETQLSLGLLHHACRRNAESRRSLQQGFEVATERQFSHFVILSPDDLAHCCRLALKDPALEAAAWPQHLLSNTAAQTDLPRPGAQRPAASDPSADHGGAVDQEDGPLLKILTLGGFQVLRDHRRPVEDRQWAGNRTKLLFKSILVHGAQDVPKDIIIEDLWPETSPSSSAQNFKVTLHRLRKCLEPGLNRHQRSSFVHLKDGLVSIDRGRCWIDVQEFLRCCREIKRERLGGEAGAIPALGERLMELYRGDFLPDDLYAPWAEMKRTALRDEYFAALMATASVYEARHEDEAAVTCCRAVLAIDPCMEQAVEKLMQLYARTGRRGHAIKAYRQLQGALADDLDVAPDQALTSLYRSLHRTT